MTEESEKPGIIRLKFNQDQGCFSCCMETGLRIYNIEPLAEKAHYELDTMGSVSQCEMLFRTNILAIVSGGPNPKFPENIVMVFDDAAKKFVLELKFPTAVKAVRMTRDKLVVALINQLLVFSFPTPTQKLFSLGTRDNPLGLCEISPLASAEKQIVVFPGHKVGSVQILDLASTEIGVSAAPVWIAAHENELGCLALNQQGTRIATASTKGTLIRVWDSGNKKLVIELRRGTDPATIYCLNFSLNSEFLCCSSDKGTVHIFAIKDASLNRRVTPDYCSLPAALGNYAESQWALANFTVPQECPCICGFSSSSSVLALCLDGRLHKYLFTSDGTCSREEYDVFIDVCEDEEEEYLNIQQV